jgi:biotin synthase
LRHRAELSKMNRDEILHWLKDDDDKRLETLWTRADRARRDNVGDEVHLRGLVEISNYCVRSCAYCGLRVGNSPLERYRMSMDEALECARLAERLGYGTLVVQSGEDPGISSDWVRDLVRRVKSETPLAVPLSLGERSDRELALWREAGADRYLLRFETSNAILYESIHPSLPGRRSDRIAMLRRIRELGYEVGSGVMIGIPGQTYDDLADDIEMFRGLDLDMIGVGPFIPHPATPLGTPTSGGSPPGENQVPNTETMTYKVIALARIVCPLANIPSTTALVTLNIAQGRELGLSRGANIVMPNLTPVKYRALYEIYPAKACIFETGEECHACLSRRIDSIGRKPGQGQGPSPNIRQRTGRTIGKTRG